MKKQKIPKDIVTSGKRKTAIAKATIKAGTGIVKINDRPLSTFHPFQQLYLSEPFELAQPILGESLKTVNITVKVHSGGQESQTEASRLALSRALVLYFKNPSLKKAFLAYDRALLVADTRRREQRKPNDSRARAARQKSYR